jgi:molybdate transport system substrate-binding protein
VKRVILVPLVLPILVTSAACHGSADSPDPGGQDLTVFAASSLTGAFTRIGHLFEQQTTGVRVVFNFGPSDGLAGQIQSEGTADVFASASPTWMDAVQKKPGVSGRADFAQNSLEVIVPAGNPAVITSIQDLGNPDVQLVLAAKGVPAGDYAREALGNAGIAKAAEANVVSNEQDDASVVQKVASNEADAAIVYSSDVAGDTGNGIEAIDIPFDQNVIATYPIAVVSGTPDTSRATRFVNLVIGSQGQAILETFGFLPPPS